MSKSKSSKDSVLQYSPESLNSIHGSVGDSLNESLNKPTPLAGVTRTRPTNFKPAAIPPPPPPPPSKNK